MSLKIKMVAVALSVPFMLAGCSGGSNDNEQYLSFEVEETIRKLFHEAEERREQERISLLNSWNIKEIKVPEILYEQTRGHYDTPVTINGEEKTCIANVALTNSGYKNVILTNCR